MIKWCEGRAMTAAGDIRLAECIDHGNVQRFCQDFTATELARETLLRTVVDGLAMQPDQVDSGII